MLILQTINCLTFHLRMIAQVLWSTLRDIHQVTGMVFIHLLNMHHLIIMYLTTLYQEPKFQRALLVLFLLWNTLRPFFLPRLSKTTALKRTTFLIRSLKETLQIIFSLSIAIAIANQKGPLNKSRPKSHARSYITKRNETTWTQRRRSDVQIALPPSHLPGDVVH